MLFPDVLPALQDWSDRHVRTYIYSSGSRLAQRDLFAHTGDGDVRKHLSGYFDTTSGPKVKHKRLSAFTSCCPSDHPVIEPP